MKCPNTQEPSYIPFEFEILSIPIYSRFCGAMASLLSIHYMKTLLGTSLPSRAFGSQPSLHSCNYLRLLNRFVSLYLNYFFIQSIFYVSFRDTSTSMPFKQFYVLRLENYWSTTSWTHRCTSVEFLEIFQTI